MLYEVITHTYNTNARKWKPRDLALARFDTISSMGLAFGLYSVAIFLVAAAVLHPNDITIKKATDAALALQPLLGDNAMRIFMAGLWGATLSTLSPTFMAGAYFISDKMGWELNVRNNRITSYNVCYTKLLRVQCAMTSHNQLEE